MGKWYSILDVRVDLLTKKEVLSNILNILSNNKFALITPINLELVMLAQKNEKFKHYLNNVSNINTIDGVGILNVFKWYKIDFNERVCGSDLAYDIAQICQQNNKKYFILGASEEVSEKAKLKLKDLYQGLLIENYSPPYTKSLCFSPNEDKIILDKIKEFAPDVLCVALGAPKQELWIFEHQEFIKASGIKLVIGLGGSYDFIAGKVQRAPEIFKRTGNEWLYRLIQEPRCRIKRQLKTIPLYYLLCFFEFLRRH